MCTYNNTLKCLKIFKFVLKPNLPQKLKKENLRMLIIKKLNYLNTWKVIMISKLSAKIAQEEIA